VFLSPMRTGIVSRPIRPVALYVEYSESADRMKTMPAMKRKETASPGVGCMPGFDPGRSAVTAPRRSRC